MSMKYLILVVAEVGSFLNDDIKWTYLNRENKFSSHYVLGMNKIPHARTLILKL